MSYRMAIIVKCDKRLHVTSKAIHISVSKLTDDERKPFLRNTMNSSTVSNPSRMELILKLYRSVMNLYRPVTTNNLIN